MSRISTALAAAAMALAAAGGGLLLAAASAVPAGASATGTPAAPHPGHTITIHAHPSGIGPHLQTLPCGSDVCDPGGGGPTISCVIIAGDAQSFESSGAVWMASDSTVQCDHPVTAISMQSSLLLNGNPVTTTTDVTQGRDHAATSNLAGCQAGVWNTGASAVITFPSGYVIIEGQNPIHDLSQGFSYPASGCVPSPQPLPGGGGGGCAVHSPSLAIHPAGRHPDLVTCP
jgi:hypothetical protein